MWCCKARKDDHLIKKKFNCTLSADVVCMKKTVVRLLYSCNHKVIGRLYLIFGVWSGFVGTSFSMLIRLNLGFPGGGVLKKDYQLFKNIITAHGLIMIFFFVMPVLMGGFGNWLLPLYLNCQDMAFPRLNNLRFWLLPVALTLILSSIYLNKGIGSG